MAGTTISIRTTLGIKLTTAGRNPVLVRAAGAIVTSGNDAIYAAGATAWRITNHGTLSAAKDGVAIAGGGLVVNTGAIGGTADGGVSMGLGGSVVNGAATAVTATISGGAYGIVIDRGFGLAEGSAGSVTNFGTVTASASTGTGIELGNGGTIGNETTGLIAGGRYGVRAAGGTTITNLGTIRQDGTLAEGAGIVIAGAGHVANGVRTAGALISGGAGVAILGTGGVINDGTIFGRDDAAVSIRFGGSLGNGGTISGASYGVVIDRSDRIASDTAATITNTGLISAVGATGAGLALGNGGSVTNAAAGVISGGRYGVRTGGATTVINRGAIRETGLTGGGAGMAIGGNAQVSNADGGVIVGDDGIAVVGRGTVANTGTIIGSGGAGVSLRFGGQLDNGSATAARGWITGDLFGVTLDASRATGAGSDATVVNHGIITAAAPTGVAVDLGNAGRVSNAAGQSITGGAYGVRAGGAATVRNLGTIRQSGSLTYGAGVAIGGDGQVGNGAVTIRRSLISGSDGVAIAGQGSVTNLGTIIGSADTGVAIRFGGSLGNGGIGVSGARIEGIGFGVDIDSSHSGAAGTAGTVANFGVIAAVGSNGVGVVLGDGGGVTNAARASILGGQYGVRTLGGTMLQNFGTIRQSGTLLDGAGIEFGGTGSVVNGAGAPGGALISGTVGVAIDKSGGVSNGGTIIGFGRAGVAIRFGGAVANEVGATIAGGDAGIVIDASGGAGAGTAGTVTNAGKISAAGTAGIAVALDNGGSVRNDGLIRGASGVVMGGVGTVTDAGTIRSGDTGIAISFGAAGSRLVLEGGALIVGRVVGADVLELAGGWAGAATGIVGATGTLQVDAGADWTPTGPVSVAAVRNDGSIEVAAGMGLTITGTVDGGSSGIFRLDADAALGIAADHGSTSRIRFGGGGALTIGHAAQFGTGVGTPGYQGPTIESFGSGDTITLPDLAAAAVTFDYTQASGLLRVSANGGAANGGAANLLFDGASLGAGVFHVGGDASGHVVITHG